jgi:hypothetical protein
VGRQATSTSTSSVSSSAVRVRSALIANERPVAGGKPDAVDIDAPVRRDER